MCRSFVTTRTFTVFAVAAAALTVAASAATSARPIPRGVTHCTAFAAPSGNDRAAGSASEPVRTVDALLRRLHAGDTGCLAGGAVFEGDVAIRHGGTPRRPLTLTSFGGRPATIRGRLYIPAHSDYVHIVGLNLDGRNQGDMPSPAVNGSYAMFRYDDVTNYHTGICFQLGNPGWGRPVGTLIARNRIHDCGQLPANNKQHGIYVEASDQATIVNNYIYDNADRGVQLFPDAQRTLVAHNVIDANGEGVIFSGDGDHASSDNRLVKNIISNSMIRHNVESWWPGPVGHSNVVYSNCLWGGADRNGNVAQPRGFELGINAVADPRFVDAAHGDFRLRSSSGCAGFGPRPGPVGWFAGAGGY
jgi:parallel beta-helix repeat protein